MRLFMRLVQACSCPVFLPPVVMVAWPGTDLQAVIVEWAGPIVMGLMALFATIDVGVERHREANQRPAGNLPMATPDLTRR